MYCERWINMKFNATNNFIEALKKWNEATKENQATDILTLIFLINFKIGTTDNEVLHEETVEEGFKLLKERIKYLVNNESVDEIFLIFSLTQQITNYFRHFLNNHSNAILFNETMLENQICAENARKTLERIKSSEYIIKLKNDYYRWLEIASVELSEEKFEEWERDLMLEESKKFKKAKQDE